jgi:hypothetical protein
VSVKAFDIFMSGTWRLSLDQIWPDGDAPENPTIDDVRAVMPDVDLLIFDWNLVPDVEVRSA